MSRLWIIIIILGINCHLGAQGFVWTTQIGMTGQPTGGDKVAVDSSGNVYVTGGFQGTANFGSTNLTSIGSEDIFLAKYNGSGNLIWIIQAGGTNNQDIGEDVCADTNGNVFIVGSFQGQTSFGNKTLIASGSLGIGTVNNQFIAKYNSSGTLIWAFTHLTHKN